MTPGDFNAAFQTAAAGNPPPPLHHPHFIAAQIVRRDQRRTRALAFLSLLFWLMGAAGMALLVVGLNRLVIFLRVQDSASWNLHAGQNAIGAQDQLLWGTDLIHHSMPMIAGSILALLLAALCTVLLVFSSRQATLNSISLSLAQMAEQMRQMRSAGSAGNPPPEPAYPPFNPAIQLMPVRSLRRTAGMIFLAVILAVAFVVLAHHRGPWWMGYPRLSPFQAIQWKQETPQVEIGGKWYELLAVNDLPITEIIGYAKGIPGPADQWQKRINEDLVELLDKMGHDSGPMVDLQVKALGSSVPQTLQDVPMTGENRDGIWWAQHAPPPPPPQSDQPPR